MRPLESSLIHYDWCPCKKKELGDRHEHTQKKDYVKTQGKDSYLQAKVQGLRRDQLCQHLDLRLFAPGLRENKCLLFKPTGLWYFVMAAVAKLN